MDGAYCRRCAILRESDRLADRFFTTIRETSDDISEKHESTRINYALAARGTVSLAA